MGKGSFFRRRMMAFFGLTQLGYQDTIREHVNEPKTTPISAFRSGTYRDADYRLPKPEQCDFPPSGELPGTRQDPTARYERGPCASQRKLDHNKTAGIMCPKGMQGNSGVGTMGTGGGTLYPQFRTCSTLSQRCGLCQNF